MPWKSTSPKRNGWHNKGSGFLISMKVIGTPLYQWEVGRKLQIIPIQGMKICAVHFSHLGDAEALVVEPREENGVLVADIPNVLLQSGSNLVAYSVYVSADCVETIKECVISVHSRPKPSDYVYTETEILGYKTLADRIAQIEQNGVSDEQIAKAVEEYLAKNAVGVPPGGKEGQYLRKKSDTDRDVEWADLVIPEQYGLVTYDQEKTITIT